MDEPKYDVVIIEIATGEVDTVIRTGLRWDRAVASKCIWEDRVNSAYKVEIRRVSEVQDA